MPTVPIEQVSQAAPTQLQGVDVSQGLQGSRNTEQLGAGLEQAGSAFSQIAAERQATVNEAKAKQYDAQLTSQITDLLHNPDGGYLNRLGANALQDNYHAAVDQITKLPQTIAGDESNPRVQQMFREIAQQRTAAALQQVTIHAAQQTQKFALDASSARAEASLQSAVQSYNPIKGANNSLFAQSMATQRAELESQAGQLGLSGDARDQFIKTGVGKTYTALVQHLVDNEQTPAARDVLNTVRDNLNPEVADQLTKLVKVSANRNDALSLAIDTRAQGGTIGQQETRLDEMFKAGKIPEEVHDMALQKLRADNVQRRSEEAESDKSTLGSVWALKTQNPNATVADLPASTLAYIKQRGLGSHVDAIFAHNDTIDDSKLFSDLMRQSAEDPAAFSRADLSKMSGSLTSGHLDRLITLQTGIDKSDAKALDITRIQNATVKNVMADIKAAGLTPAAKPGSTKADEFAKFEASLHDALIAENDQRQAAGKPPLKPDEAKTVAQGLLKEQALAGTGIFGVLKTSGRTYDVVEKIPVAERDTISRKLSAAGLAPTPTNILDYYNRANAKK